MTKIQLRRGTAAQWTSVNPVLASGEPGVETDTDRLKLGDGSTSWGALSYASSIPDAVLTLTPSDAFGRIKVTSEPMPSVMDPAWGAHGDGSTDDTVAVQAAVNALSTVGTARSTMIPLRFPSGRNFVLDRVIPSSWVDINAYGAMFTRTGSHNNGLFAVDPTLGVGTSIDHFAIRGASHLGTQAEQTNMCFVRICKSTNIWVEDCTVDNINAPGIYLMDCQHLRVIGNKLIRMGSLGNPINFVSGIDSNTVPLQFIWCQNNYVDHISGGGEGISIVQNNQSTRTDPVVDAHINNNTVQSETSGGLIFVEQGGNVNPPPNISGIDISGNTIFNNSGALNAHSIEVALTATVPGNDPLCISGVTIVGNRIFGSGTTSSNGIHFDGSKSVIAHNYIEASNNDIHVLRHGTAVNHHLTIVGNQGGLGSGNDIDVVAGAVDPTTCRFDYAINDGDLGGMDTSGTAAPTTGTWRLGARCWNTAPTATGTLLWVCTTAGTPGTWTASTLP